MKNVRRNISKVFSMLKNSRAGIAIIAILVVVLLMVELLGFRLPAIGPFSGLLVLGVPAFVIWMWGYFYGHRDGEDHTKSTFEKFMDDHVSIGLLQQLMGTLPTGSAVAPIEAAPDMRVSQLMALMEEIQQRL